MYWISNHASLASGVDAFIYLTECRLSNIVSMRMHSTIILSGIPGRWRSDLEILRRVRRAVSTGRLSGNSVT